MLENGTMTLRGKLIEEIVAVSPHSSPEFLGRFTSEQLRNYLEHLQLTIEPRGTRWKRQGTSPAVVQYRPTA
jgi:hypothetical protein